MESPETAVFTCCSALHPSTHPSCTASIPSTLLPRSVRMCRSNRGVPTPRKLWEIDQSTQPKPKAVYPLKITQGLFSGSVNSTLHSRTEELWPWFVLPPLRLQPAAPQQLRQILRLREAPEEAHALRVGRRLVARRAQRIDEEARGVAVLGQVLGQETPWRLLVDGGCRVDGGWRAQVGGQEVK